MYLHRGKYRLSKVECWNLDHTLAKVIFDSLCQFKVLERYGYPNKIFDIVKAKHNDTDNTENNGKYDKECIELWEKNIDDMIFSFKEISTDYKNSPFFLDFEKNYGKIPQDKSDKTKEDEILKQEKEYRDRVSHGLQLFSEYFQALWD
ncbi:hypothetical protein [Succinivibrio dextrinosolvens]|uniref:hypothetical protein n=1 Tax=Succinivibrio dextrinosolvens TaxID=83771 RepID=UPI00192173A1|nr:hypothetical protein [Succinivibrio dextrinosolvens]